MSTRPVIRLADLFRRVRGGDSRNETETALRQKLGKARVAARKWRSRARAFAIQLREVTAQRSASDQALRRANIVRRQALRQVPSAKLVRSTFIHRARTLQARVDARAAGEREARFVLVSAPFRRALGSTAEAPDSTAQPLHVDGITWWVPAAALKRAGGLRVPHNGILQAREVAIGGIMLDLGANLGRMSIARVVVGEATAAYCAEPDPVNFACLARTVIDNGLRGLVLPDQTAIGDRNGVVRLLRTGRSGSRHVVPDASADPKHTVEVPCATLDAWVERLQIDLDAVTFIKVDIQGFERRMIAGASRVLGCPHIAWQMEIYPPGLRDAGDDPQALFADLQQAFTHFIDLTREARGRRVRQVSQLPDALRYVEPDGKTDLLLFTASSGATV